MQNRIKEKSNTREGTDSAIHPVFLSAKKQMIWRFPADELSLDCPKNAALFFFSASTLIAFWFVPVTSNLTEDEIAFSSSKNQGKPLEIVVKKKAVQPLLQEWLICFYVFNENKVGKSLLKRGNGASERILHYSYGSSGVYCTLQIRFVSWLVLYINFSRIYYSRLLKIYFCIWQIENRESCYV